MMRKRNSDVLLETLELAGRTVIDIGCGDGGLTRLMARNGAHVLGVEVSSRQLAKAQAAAPVADERFVAGRAEELPAPDSAADIVIFFNSLHHVPVEGQDKAIAEAARALKPGGLLYVSEPVAEGPLFELIKPIDDETEIRAHAYRMLQESTRHGFEPVREFIYVHTVRHTDFESFRDRVVSADAEREALFADKDTEMRALYARLGVPGDGGLCFDQPTRVNLLRRG